ncbi:MAG: Fic family protein [Phycisphaerales bacterium]|jgi:Fic family protein
MDADSKSPPNPPWDLKSRFSDVSPGMLVPVTMRKRAVGASGSGEWQEVETWAFVPDDLPPRLDWKAVKGELFDAFAGAHAALGRVNGLVHAVPNAEILRQALWLREARLSSKIEGIETTALDMVLAGEEGGKPNPGREALNAVRAVQLGIEKDQPFGGDLVRDMHRRLLDGVRGEELQPGEFRDVPVFIGVAGRPDRARFVPPADGGAVARCMASLETFVNGDWPQIPELAQVALAHYQFEAVHPFRDGNGRIGRALVLHQMCALGLLDMPIVSPSGYFQRHRQEYVDRMRAVSERGAWVEWLRFFVEAVAEEAVSTRLLAERIVAAHGRYAAQLRDHAAAGRLLRLLDHVFGWPLVTAATAAQVLDVTDPTARKDLALFEEHGILARTDESTYGKTWYAPAVLDVAEAEYAEFPDG